MSIPSIRQRKALKSNRSIFQNRILTDHNQDHNQSCSFRFQTEIISNDRESFSSRPTFLKTQQTKQVAYLQKKVKQQQMMTEKYFEQMQNLENCFEKIRQQQKKKYDKEIECVKARIRKQQERNRKAGEKKNYLISQIIRTLMEGSKSKKFLNCTPIQNEKQRTQNEYRNRIARQVLQSINFQITKRQMRKNQSSPLSYMGSKQNQKKEENVFRNGEDAGTPSSLRRQNQTYNHNQSTLVFDIKNNSEERQSESILLDDLA